ELYLNQIDMGNHAYGVEAAAQRYFGKSARDLNVAEAASLAAIPKATDRYNPRKNPQNNIRRPNLIIDLLKDDGRLTPEEAETWKAYPLALSARSDYSASAEYFTAYVRSVLEPVFGADLDNGLVIHTTLDLDIQQAATRACEEQAEKIEDGEVGRYKHPSYRD